MNSPGHTANSFANWESGMFVCDFWLVDGGVEDGSGNSMGSSLSWCMGLRFPCNVCC